jgi:ubiquinone/menaquinone biosynthesis C-methylase UbiE
MNQDHELCGSDEWRAHVQEKVLPEVLGSTDLGRDLLEVGPGYGATTDWLRHRVARLTAVEIDAGLAGPLEERYAGTNVEVVRGDATAMSFADSRFTAATSFFMLHHVPSPELQDQLFAEVARVLRPGGAFVAADSVASDALRGFHEDDTYQPIDPASLPARLASAGFTDVQVQVGEDGWAATATAV